MRIKRWLFLGHRWLGVAMCAFFAMWFVSGVVMMYVGYPKLTPAERLAHLPALDAGAAYLAPRAALDAAGIGGPLRDLRLAASRAGRPVYLAVPAAGSGMPGPAGGRRAAAPGAGTVVIDALSGAVLRGIGADEALAAAAAWAAADAPGGALPPMRYEGTVDEDAFTHSRNLDAHRPLHVVQLDDAPHTRLYLSGTTGEVVRDATRAERGWNYAGAWIHWLYPFRGHALDRWWADIVIVLSLVGIAVALTGTVVGLLRWRFGRRYRSGARSPYAGGAMRWHHLSGLLFAGVTLTWIFSGLMSMNPWKLFDSGAPPLRTEALAGGPLRPGAEAAAPQRLLAAAGRPVRELRWVRVAGEDRVL
ncbi:PepSY domain-containing protein, partial [uncultured Xylophilus sp.]|uniref:PepSY domain-containing protein n=1 Tax=uncultured Xylophilus sp. TaxID=296832 RepID=UPI0025FC9DB3